MRAEATTSASPSRRGGASHKARSDGGLLHTVAAVVLLWIVVISGAALAGAYAAGVPPWNAPDEPAHFNYVKSLATTGQLPELKMGDWDAPLLERLKSTRFPKGESVDSIRYENWQPPLFYLLASPMYNATDRFPLGEQVVLLRMVSVVLSTVTVVLAFFAVRAVFPQDLPLQLAAAGFIAFLPMRSAIAGSINNDALAEMLATLLLLELVWIAGSGLSRRRAVLLGITLGAALLTKMTLYGIAGLALPAALLLGGNRGKGAGSRPRLAALTAAVTLAISGWWFVRNGLLYGWTDIFAMQRHSQVVVGQPRLERLDGAALSYLGTTLFKSFWGQFGWMGILIDERLYQVLGLVSALASFGLILFLRRAVFEKGFLTPYQKVCLTIMGLAVGVAVAQLLFFNLTFIQAQGRYLYPALLPIALFFVLGLRELMSPIHARLLLALSVASLGLLDLVCLTRFVLPYFT